MTTVARTHSEVTRSSLKIYGLPRVSAPPRWPQELAALHGLCWAKLHGECDDLQAWREARKRACLGRSQVFALCCLLRAGDEV